MMIFRNSKKPAATPVDNIFLELLMPDAPEIAVKAYLYGLMLAGKNDAETDIADALGVTEEDVRAAFSYWSARGAVKIVSEEPLSVCFLDPAEAVAGRVGNAAYSDLVKALQKVLGTRNLSGAELSKIYDWIDVFGFTKEAAVEIVRQCLNKKGAKTPVRYMDAVANSLAAEGAFTLEAVRESFEARELYSTGAAKILKRWNRRGLPTEDQIALYEKWTKEWNVDEYTLNSALSQMVNADKPSFGYLDAILSEWREKGEITKEAVEARQKREDTAFELARQAFQRAGLKSRPTSRQAAEFGTWLFDWHMNAELVLLAAEYAAKDAKPFAALKRIVGGWHDEGISSVSAARESYERDPGAGRRSAKTNRALSYMHGNSYSEEELKKLGISFGEEFYDDNDEE